MLSCGKVPAIFSNGGYWVALILLAASLDAQTYSPSRVRLEATFCVFYRSRSGLWRYLQTEVHALTSSKILSAN